METTIKRIINEEIEMPEKEKKGFGDFFLQYQYILRECWNKEEQLEDFLKKKEKTSWQKPILELKSYLDLPYKDLLRFCVNQKGNKIDPNRISQKIDPEETYRKVKAGYEFVTGKMIDGRKRFNLLIFEEQVGPITVAGANQEKEYQLEPLKRAIAFAKENQMQVKLNSMCFFRDFPNRLVGKKKEELIREIENYGKMLGKWMQKEKDCPIISMNLWKQFVYADEPYDLRKNAWHSRLSIQDFCDIALYLKSQMPNVRFSYSDFDFEVPEKRNQIFEVLDQMQAYEKEHGVKGKLLEAIEIEMNLDFQKDPEAIETGIKETKKRYSLPIEVLLYQKDKEEELKKSLGKEEKQVIEKIKRWKNDNFYQVIIHQAEKKKIEQLTIGNLLDESFEETEEREIPTKEELKIWEEIQKNKEDEKNKIRTTRQDFNYHTHTRRCGHAEDTSDENFVKHAIQAGLKAIAFTDHVPFNPKTRHQIRPKIRMDYEEVEEYLHSIEYLKKKYEGRIEIQSGFEFEYARKDKEYFQMLRKRVDKMVLGQHFVIDEQGRDCRVKLHPTDEILDRYADSVIEAMELGLADIVVHPDYFLSKRDGFFEKEEMITRRLCFAAQKYGVPFEINLGQIGFQKRKEKIGYPNREFWRIVSEYDIGVIYGKDAHWTEQITDESVFEIADQIIGKETIQKLKFLESDLKTPKSKKKKTRKSFEEQLQELDQEVPEKERNKVMKDLLKMEEREKKKQNR